MYALVESLAADRIVMVAWMLHGGCVGEEAVDSDLPAGFLNLGASDFPFKIPCRKCCICFFSLAPRSGFEAAISHAVAHSGIVLLCFAIQYLDIAL